MRRFSLAACWLLSWLTTGTLTMGDVQDVGKQVERQAAAHGRHHDRGTPSRLRDERHDRTRHRQVHRRAIPGIARTPFEVRHARVRPARGLVGRVGHDVIALLRDVGLDQRAHQCGCQVGHQTKVDRGLRVRRHGVGRLLPHLAGPQAAHVQRRDGDRSISRGRTRFASAECQRLRDGVVLRRARRRSRCARRSTAVARLPRSRR